VRVYCPVRRNTGFCGGGSPPVELEPALKGAVRFVTSVSGVFPPGPIELVVVVTMAIAPASHILT
jgi:hypothetical protein